MVYIDLSEPDTVTVYPGNRAGGLEDLIQGLQDLFGGIIEYFR